jgi:predicted lactoylglutathione lyase
MTTQIYVNLPVKDIKKANEFFLSLGFTFNEQYCNEQATCVFINTDAYIMLLSESFFKSFTQKEVAYGDSSTEVLVCLSAESKEKVNEMVEKALTIGGIEAKVMVDVGYMYSRSFHDLDGHIWEIMWMDPAGFPQL